MSSSPRASSVSYRRAAIYDAPEWYDVDYAGYRGEEAFYRVVIERHAKAGGATVELGAGTGRLALRLASGGFRVHAVEPAPAMRAVLVERARGAFDVEDATALTFIGPAARVDCVLFPFNGVLHLETRAELLASFRHVRERLHDDGRFALDLTGPYWEAMLYGPTDWGRDDERVHPVTGQKVRTCDRARYEPRTREMVIEIRYLVEGAANVIEITLRQTMWTWQQVLGALDEAGFAVDLLFGDVDMAPFAEGSTRLLVSARKA